MGGPVLQENLQWDRIGCSERAEHAKEGCGSGRPMQREKSLNPGFCVSNAGTLGVQAVDRSDGARSKQLSAEGNNCSLGLPKPSVPPGFKPKVLPQHLPIKLLSTGDSEDSGAAFLHLRA